MNKKILNLAIPNILSNLSIPLLSSIDTAVVGHLDKVYYLGAIAVGSMIFSTIYWAFGFLRMGTTGFTAQAKGKKDKTEQITIFIRAIIISLLVAFILLLFKNVISEIAFSLISGSENVEYYAESYFQIRIWAAPATLALYVFQGWFIGMQNAKYPMVVAVLGNLLNIGFNLFFVYVLNMNSDGVALGTVAAQYISLLIAGLLFLKKYKNLLKNFSADGLKNYAEFKKFFKLNTNIFIRTVALISVLSYFTAVSANYGDNIVAANTILLQLWMIVAYGIDGFAFAAESLVGNYFGEKNLPKLKLVIKYCFYWGLSSAVVISFIYFFFEQSLIMFYTNIPKVIELAKVYYKWIVIAPIINSVCFIFDGIFVGATAGKAMRNSVLISSVLIFFPSYYLLNTEYGNTALWFSLTLWMISRGGLLFLMLKKHIYEQ